MPTRRDFLGAVASTAGLLTVSHPGSTWAAPPAAKESHLSYGLVTYMWAHDWDLPTLIANCEECEVKGVELRTTHKHGVEPSLSEKQREAVRRRFADSQVTLVGIGSNERYDSPDPTVLKKAVEDSKEFIRLSHDVGGTGVKVKPDSFHKAVPREKTIAQIAKALHELGEYGAGFGQQIRLEVHGQCAELPTIKAIMDQVDQENVAVCWNSNPQDLQGEGLQHNFGLVRSRFGDTVHIHELDSGSYPWPEFVQLLLESDYRGWLLLEAGSQPGDRVAALEKQRKLFDGLVAKLTKG